MATHTTPRRARVWTYCTHGHLFYAESTTTRCHVCKAHGLPDAPIFDKHQDADDQPPPSPIYEPVYAPQPVSYIPPDPGLELAPLPKATFTPPPAVIVTPPPAREPQPLHDNHVQARRRWRKALADMLREERASRDGQSAFRAGVLANYGGRCAITGTAIDVEAAHIEPWRENGNQEPDNGVPLVWALHKCYDRTPAMFAIHPDTLRIHVRPDVVGLESIDGRQIADGQLYPLNRDALRARWAAFLAYRITT